MTAEHQNPETPRRADQPKSPTGSGSPPRALLEQVASKGTWVREGLAHGTFEAWHFFPDGSAGSAPTHVFIQPAEGSDPSAVARGVTTTVLREMRPAEAADTVHLLRRTQRAAKYPLAERVETLLRTPKRPTEAYLAAVALRYERLADAGNRSPVRSLVDITGLPLGTIKSHIQLARKKGLLEAVGAKAGGRATGRAHALVAEAEAETGDDD